MALEVFDISRKEVERWFNRKTVVRMNRVNATSDYLLVSLSVSFDADFYDYWHPTVCHCNWQLIAHRQFSDLKSVQEWAESHHLVSEHLVSRSSQKNDYACGFEIWHLVDDETDVAEVEALPDLLEMSKGLATVRYVGDDVVRGNFKSTQRVMFDLGFDDLADTELYIQDGLDWLNLRYGISGACSTFAFDDLGCCWTCTILLQYDGPCSVGWWYERLRWFRDIQRLDWVFYRVCYVSDYMHYVMKRYYHVPKILTGVFDSDATRRLAALVYADYYAPTTI